jgi:hypothetical protein
VKAAVEGRLPRGVGVTRLRAAPAEWRYSAATIEATKNRTRNEGRASVPRIALPTAQRSTVAVDW